MRKYGRDRVEWQRCLLEMNNCLRTGTTLKISIKCKEKETRCKAKYNFQTVEDAAK